MTVDEVRRLIAQSPFTLAGHTTDHPDLRTLDDSAVHHQIEHCHARISEMTGSQPSFFAYPYGLFDARVRGVVAQAGVRWACSTDHRAVDPTRYDPLALPRLTAADVPDLAWLE